MNASTASPRILEPLAVTNRNVPLSGYRSSTSGGSSMIRSIMTGTTPSPVAPELRTISSVASGSNLRRVTIVHASVAAMTSVNLTRST